MKVDQKLEYDKMFIYCYLKLKNGSVKFQAETSSHSGVTT